MDLRLIVRMFCNRCACVARRFCIKLDAKSRVCAEISQNFRPIRRRTRTKSAAQACNQCIDVLCDRRSNSDAFAQILRATRARCARKFCKHSPKSARISPKNRAHFRRATRRIITKIIVSDTGSRHGPSVDRAHVLHALHVRGALILRETRCKFARFSPKTSGKIRENHRGTRARPAAQA